MTVEDYETRNILDRLQRHHAGPIHDWDTFTQRLERTTRDYAGRRTIQAHMVEAVAELAYGYVAEQLATPQTERDAEVAKLVGVIERLEKRVADQHDTIVRQGDLLDDKRTIREEREAARQDGETDVVISNGYHGWTVAGLEEIAYRLRCGGAADDTPVDVDKARAKASVPAPNMVTLNAPTTSTHETFEPTRASQLPDLQDQQPDAWPRAPLRPLVLVASAASMLSYLLGWVMFR